jgi:SAM-dependent methyltransferase
MSEPTPYYAPGSLSAAFYDVVTAADATVAGDLEVYAGLAPAGGAVLELGAGSGRLTLALARGGFRVTGIDIAPAMLAQADAARTALPPTVAERVRLKLADMTALDLHRTFDLVICPFFTLAHVPPARLRRRTFAAAGRHLKPGGYAAFHLPMRHLMRLPAPADPQRPVFDRELPSGGRLQLHVRRRAFDEAAGRFDQLVEYVERDAGGGVRACSTELQTFYITDPTPLAAPASLIPRGPPVPLGGVGEIWVFRKA